MNRKNISSYNKYDLIYYYMNIVPETLILTLGGEWIEIYSERTMERMKMTAKIDVYDSKSIKAMKKKRLEVNFGFWTHLVWKQGS